MYLGLNLIHQNDYDSDEKFANLFLNSRSPQLNPWVSTPPTIDAQGWPVADFTQVIYGYSSTYKVGPSGTYALKFTGKAVLGAYGGTLSNQVYDGTTTTATLTVPSSWSGNVYITFSGTQRTANAATGTGLTNLLIMRPIAEGSGTPHDYSEFLSRNFTAYLANGPYQGLRFMDMLGTNTYASSITTLSWGQRTPGFMPNQSGPYSNSHGTSIEICVAVANALNKDMFFNMPDLADADYMLKALQTIAFGSDGTNPYTSPQQNPVFAPLNANLKFFIEWGNEVWNSTFGQNARNAALAAQLVSSQTSPVTYDGTTDVYLVFHRLWGEKTVQISKLARQVFGDAAMMTRVRPVIFGQDDSGDNNGILRTAFDFINGYYNNSAHVSDPHPLNYYIWGGGCGAYRGWVSTDTSGTTSVEAILSSGVAGDPPAVNTLGRPALLASHGLKSVIYEGALELGNDTCTDFSYGFNQDARLRPLVKQYYDDLAAAGYDCLFIFASSNGNYSQCLSTEPAHVAAGARYLAAQDFAGENAQPRPVEQMDTPTWINLDNLASTTLAIAHVAGSPSLVLKDASHFTPTPSDPRILTVIKADGSVACHYLATGKVGNVLTVTPTDGYSDPGFKVGDKVIESFSMERLQEVRDQIDSLVAAHNGLAAVAESGDYQDLKNKPTIPVLPALAPVATSGSYTDLTDKPTIPTPPVLATVATTGSYTDLLNKPTLGTLAAQNGTFSGSSSGNNTGDQTIVLQGDVSGSGTGTFTTTLATTAVTAGSYTIANVTVDGKGRVTSATSGTPVTPGGSNGQIQYNGNNAFAAASITTDGTNLNVPGNVNLSGGSALGTNALYFTSAATVTSTSTLLKFTQTGDQFGASSLELLNRVGVNGVRFSTAIWLVDMVFRSNQNALQGNIRYNTDNTTLAANTQAKGGEFYFYMNSDGAGGNPASIAAQIGAGACKFHSPSVFVADATAGVPLTCQAAANQSADLFEAKDASGNVLTSIGSAGGFHPVHLADSAAANDTMYYSTTLNKLAYKDASGAVNPLY